MDLAIQFAVRAFEAAHAEASSTADQVDFDQLMAKVVPPDAKLSPNLANGPYRRGCRRANGTDVNYTVTHAGGTDTVAVNQLLNSGTWFKLGTYDLLPGAGHKVMISDRASGAAVADSIRLVSSSQGARVARWSGMVGSAGTYQVWGRWTAAPSHTFAATYDITTPGGTQSVTIDQRSGGGQWHLLKTLSLAANDQLEGRTLRPDTG